MLFIHADNDIIIDVEQSISLHKGRLQEGLISELYIQKSTPSFTKGHNNFEYDRDVIIPSRDFLGKYVSYQGLWGIVGTNIDKYRVVPSVYSVDRTVTAINKLNKNHKLYTVCGCARCAICPCVFCIEGWVAITSESCTCITDSILGFKKKYKYESKMIRTKKNSSTTTSSWLQWNKRHHTEVTTHSIVENPIIHGEEDNGHSSINYLPG